MEIIGLDLHKRERQLSIKADDGTITDRQIATSRERFTAVFGGRPRSRILPDASTENEWVATPLGIAQARGDRRRSEQHAESRQSLVQMRTRYIALAKALVRRDGLRSDHGERACDHMKPHIGDITRFRTAHELAAYLGVIPSERSSGEKR
jgi:transposase